MKDKRLQVKGIKTFKGREGVGLNATLYFDGKKVCEVMDSADGGEMDYHWIKPSWEDEVEAYVKTLTPRLASVNIRAGFVLDEKREERPDLRCPKCGSAKVFEVLGGRLHGDLYCEPCNELLEFVGNTLDSFVNDWVDEAETEKAWKRACKTKTLFRRAGDPAERVHQVGIAFTPANKAAILKKWPDVVEWINERYAA
jgi:hypothetical protein